MPCWAQRVPFTPSVANLPGPCLPTPCSTTCTCHLSPRWLAPESTLKIRPRRTISLLHCTRSFGVRFARKLVFTRSSLAFHSFSRPVALDLFIFFPIRSAGCFCPSPWGQCSFPVFGFHILSEWLSFQRRSPSTLHACSMFLYLSAAASNGSRE